MQIPNTEAEIYFELTRDGDSLDVIRRRAAMLRDRYLQEKQERVFKLTKVDPVHKDRHEAEAARIQEERNRKLDEVLMEVANRSTAQMPAYKEAYINVSQKVGIPRTSISAWLALPFLFLLSSPLILLTPLIAYICFVFLKGTMIGWIVLAAGITYGLVECLSWVKSDFDRIRKGESAIKIIFQNIWAWLREIFR